MESSRSARASTRLQRTATIAWVSRQTGWTAILPQPPPTVSGRATSPISGRRSEEHTSELQSLMRISYAVFCLKKKTKQIKQNIKQDEQNQTNKIQIKDI